MRNLRAAGSATLTRRGQTLEIAAKELTRAEAVTFFRDVFAPVVCRYGGPGAWIVRNVDKIDIDDPADAANGRPVFELHSMAVAR